MHKAFTICDDLLTTYFYHLRGYQSWQKMNFTGADYIHYLVLYL